MKNRKIALLFIAATALSAAVLAAETKTPTVRVDRTAMVGASVLPAGTFEVVVAPATYTVKFVQQGRTIAEVPCTVAPSQVVYGGSAAYFRPDGGGGERLMKIVLGDPRLAIEFPTGLAGGTVARGAESSPRP